MVLIKHLILVCWSDSYCFSKCDTLRGHTYHCVSCLLPGSEMQSYAGLLMTDVYWGVLQCTSAQWIRALFFSIGPCCVQSAQLVSMGSTRLPTLHCRLLSSVLCWLGVHPQGVDMQDVHALVLQAVTYVTALMLQTLLKLCRPHF